jgi:hypothetical protein
MLVSTSLELRLDKLIHNLQGHAGPDYARAKG